MDNQQVIALSQLEDLDLSGDTEYFNKQLFSWVRSICIGFKSLNICLFDNCNGGEKL